MTASAVFVRDGEAYVATELGLGPWYPGALHGGAPAALIARVLAGAVPDPMLRLARVTYEFVRPVMIGPLSAATELVRPGRRVTLIDGTLRDGAGLEVLRARALFSRPATFAAGPDEPPPFGGPEDGAPNDWQRSEPMFATHAMEVRFVQGRFGAVGPSIAWFRLRVPMIAGEQVLGIERIASAGDFGNGIASVLDWSRHSFINPDLTLYLERDPVDEWVALQAEMRVARGSVASATSVLWDRRGRIGIALQSLLVEELEREAAPAVTSGETP
jgi:Acyl-CoA thioesterase C-terminal domain/Acyl-CoA thioesterase N-terminal domain